MADPMSYGKLLEVIIGTLNVEEIAMLLKENGTNPLMWSLMSKLDTIPVTLRIRKYVVKGDVKEAWRLKESYKDTFSMEAVAAAIIAQIAITMPGLSDFGTIHWTATAFAYTSLVSGLLSTFFSFYVQQILSDLHTAEDVQEWLTSPRVSFVDRLLGRTVGKFANSGDRIPSLTAAAALTAPGRLLAFSIITLFVALGIYLGSVYTAKLGALEGRNANLAVLLFFIIFATWAISEIFLPLYIKKIEEITALHSRDGEEPSLQSADQRDCKADAESTTKAAIFGNPSEMGVVIREALQASIRAQEESLKAQKALLQSFP